MKVTLLSQEEGLRSSRWLGCPPTFPSCGGCLGDPEVEWGEQGGFPLLHICCVTLSSSHCLSGPTLGPKC